MSKKTYKPRDTLTVSWPMMARANAQYEAYQNALDWFTRLPPDAARARVIEKMKQKNAIVMAYEAQSKS